MERCPVCKAKLKDDPVCYRCGADLSTLLGIEKQAARLEQRVVALYGAGALGEARWVAEQALALKRSPLLCRLVEFLTREKLNPSRSVGGYAEGAINPSAPGKT